MFFWSLHAAPARMRGSGVPCVRRDDRSPVVECIAMTLSVRAPFLVSSRSDHGSRDLARALLRELDDVPGETRHSKGLEKTSHPGGESPSVAPCFLQLDQGISPSGTRGFLPREKGASEATAARQVPRSGPSRRTGAEASGRPGISLPGRAFGAVERRAIEVVRATLTGGVVPRS